MTLDEMLQYVKTFVEVPAAQIPDPQLRIFLRQGHSLVVSLRDWPWLRAADKALNVPGGATGDGMVTVDQTARVVQVTLNVGKQELAYIGHETAVRYYGDRTGNPTQWSVIGHSGDTYAIHLWPKPTAAITGIIASSVAVPALWPSDTSASTSKPGDDDYPVPESLHLPIADYALGTTLIQKGDPNSGLLLRQSALDTIEAVWRSVTPTNLSPFLAGTETIRPGPRPLTEPYQNLQQVPEG